MFRQGIPDFNNNAPRIKNLGIEVLSVVVLGLPPAEESAFALVPVLLSLGIVILFVLKDEHIKECCWQKSRAGCGGYVVDVVCTHHPTSRQSVSEESLCWAACASVFQFPNTTLHLYCLKRSLILCFTRYLTIKTVNQPVSISLDAVAGGSVGYCRLTGQRGQVFLHRQKEQHAGCLTRHVERCQQPTGATKTECGNTNTPQPQNTE